MTIYTDNLGNKFLGDCIYGNHNLNYPNNNYLLAHPHTSISNELQSLFTQAGLKYRNVLSQTLFEERLRTNIPTNIFSIGANSDSIDDRWTWNIGTFGSRINPATINQDWLTMYNNSGNTTTNNSISFTNYLYSLAYSVLLTKVIPYYANYPTLSGTRTFGNPALHFYDYILGGDSYLYSPISWCGVCDGESLGLFMTQTKLDINISQFVFIYIGLLTNLNNNYGFTADITSRYIALCGRDISEVGGFTGGTVPPPIKGSHYQPSNHRLLLDTSKAIYPITCADGQIPTAQWATDFYAFSDREDLGFPVIGKARNLLLATGNFTIGKPVKIEGTVLPDNGSNLWLPVGKYAEKILLMRCYSSVDL